MPRISFLKIVGYLEQLAENHVQVNDHYRWNVHEVEGSLRSGVELPVLFVDPVEVKPSGDAAKTFHANITAFTVLGKPNNNTGELDSYAAQNAVLDYCQQICFDIEERIINDAAIPRIDGEKNWLYGLVDKSSFNIIKVGPLFTDQLYGYRCELTLKNQVPLMIDNSKWKDLTPAEIEGMSYELDMELS
jgi:hypothetical protein